MKIQLLNVSQKHGIWVAGTSQSKTFKVPVNLGGRIIVPKLTVPQSKVA